VTPQYVADGALVSFPDHPKARWSGTVSRFSWHCEIFGGLPIRLPQRTCHANVTWFMLDRTWQARMGTSLS